MTVCLSCAAVFNHHCVCVHSTVGGDTERVNLLLRQYMCPSVYNNWPTDM